MSDPLVIIVTGSSRGIGKGITNVLAQQNIGRPMIIYATSRSGSNTGIEVAHSNSVRYSKLDITDHHSIESLFSQVLKEHGAVDVLINNAAVASLGENHEIAARNISTNYGGTAMMCREFLRQPALRPGARIVNMTSGLNALSTYGANVQQSFRAVSRVTDIDALAQSYLAAQRAGPEAVVRAEWQPNSSYKVSKALINTLTVVLSREHPNVLINCCCPGWVNTDMGNLAPGKPPKTPEEGARTAVRCAIGDLGSAGNADGGLGKEGESLSGRFYENDNVIVPGWGNAKIWMET
jgi:carbonyl reductase 1